MVRELRDVASVFTALKEFSSNPLQTMIEQKVGSMAAGVIERSFSTPAEKPNQDIFDRILNSQAGAGLGAGLGQRGPELIDKLFGLFGKEKTEDWITGAIGGRGGGSGIPGAPGPGQQPDTKQSEVDLILQLDPTNPEHITAYAASQGGIPLDVARKMLLVHQDAFIKKMEHDGQIDKANEVMLRRNNQLLNYKEEQVNVQEYRSPSGTGSTPYFDEQNLNVEEQNLSVPNDIKSRQLEPDAFTPTDSMNPQLKPEIVEIGQEQEQGQQVENGEQQVGNGEQVQSNDNDYLRQLTEMIKEQNSIISQLKSDLDIIKDRDIEKTRIKNDKTDESIFGGVRRSKGIKIGKEE